LGLFDPVRGGNQEDSRPGTFYASIRAAGFHGIFVHHGYGGAFRDRGAFGGAVLDYD
jgi:hypothetical protein